MPKLKVNHSMESAYLGPLQSEDNCTNPSLAGEVGVLWLILLMLASPALSYVGAGHPRHCVYPCDVLYQLSRKNRCIRKTTREELVGNCFFRLFLLVL